MEKELDLPTAVAELWEYVATNAFDPRQALAEMKLPPRESKRIFEHEGCRYKVTFSRILAPGAPPGTRESYLLSVAKLGGIYDHLDLADPFPDEEEGAAIARAFFPNGCIPLPANLDALKLSRKYIALKK